MRVPEYNWICADVETVGRDGIAEFLDEVKPHGGYKKQELIDADLAAKRAAQRKQVGLDPNLNRIVSLCYQTEIMARPRVHLCKTEEDEREALELFWHLRCRDGGPLRTFIGFCNGTFDALVMVQRTRLLGLGDPPIEIRRYDDEHIRDLYRALAFPGIPHTSVMGETLENFCRLFGIDVEDNVDGSEIADLIEAGEWDIVGAHNEACVKRTVALARAIGAIHVPSTEHAEVI